MDDHPDLVWGLLASLFVANTLLLVLNLPMAPLWAKLLRIPRPYLYAGILFFASLGAYSVNFQAFDLALLLVLGVLGFFMRRFGIPVLPLIIGVILGPKLEEQLTTALKISQGDVSTLWSEPVAVVVYAVMALLLIAMAVAGLRRPAEPPTPDREDEKELIER
jgi:putative tricarboxylic transport membrane protein